MTSSSIDLLSIIVHAIQPHVRTLHLSTSSSGNDLLFVTHHDGTQQQVEVSWEKFLTHFPSSWFSSSSSVSSSSFVSVSGEEEKETEECIITLHIQSLLQHEYPILSTPWKHVNIIGEPQSGKSRFLMAVCWMLTHVWKLPVALIVMNMIDSYNQVMLRDIVSFNQWIKSQGGKTNHELSIVGMRHSPSPASSSTSLSIHVCMGNAAQLRRLLKCLPASYSLVIDEADTLIKHWDAEKDGSKSGQLFQQMVDQSKSVWNVTATPFALLNRNGVECLSWNLPIPQTYRGLSEFQIHSISCEQAKRLKRDVTLLVDYISHEVFPSMEQHAPYQALLVNVYTRQKQQEEFARKWFQQYPHIPVFVLNSESPSFVKQITGDGMVGLPFPTVSSLFDEMERIYQTSSTVHQYLLVANKTAGRAISFRPSPLMGNGGLCGEILIPSTTIHGASLIQSLRLCGHYSESYPPLHLFLPKLQHERLVQECDNLQRLVQKNTTWGVPREQIEGTLLRPIGLHDRKQVDDTHISLKKRLFLYDFDSLEDALSCVPVDVRSLPHVWMTEETVEPMNHVADFVYTKNRKEQQVWQRRLKLSNEHRLQICWSEPRYRDLHNVQRRFGTQRQHYLCHSIVGDGVDTSPLYRVRWKSEFTRDDLSITDDTFWSTSLFLYRTTRAKYRVYHPTLVDVPSIGVLQHS